MSLFLDVYWEYLNVDYLFGLDIDVLLSDVLVCVNFFFIKFIQMEKVRLPFLYVRRR